MLNNKKILITGGAGFVGSNLVKKTLELGARVIVLDDLFTGEIKNLPKSNKLKFIEGSVTDIDLVEKIVNDVDIIFHLAARNIAVSTRDPRNDYEVNIGGTLNILLAAKKSKVERIVYTSSGSVYGNSNYLPINENDAKNILHPYAASKFGGENYCMAFYEMYQMPISIVRYSNVYGRNQNISNPYCGVITKFIDCVMNNKPILIHGDGLQTRDYTYIDDAVDATISAAITSLSIGEVFNIASGIETSVNDLANKIIKLACKGTEINHIDKRDIDNVRRRVLNIENARRKLRWIPNTTLEKGLIETIKWFKMT